ncbi:MAG: cytochrome d ubiquinol oxidase subunit II [Thermoleophilia bacterium]|nr:cytochrome d ubiquinol oxidase subunit II [Thermoleophilia bacterium]
MNYQAIWFVLWSVLWAVYFTTDGFDFGAGMLQRFVSRSEKDRRTVNNTMGPVWDGNEVWLLTAGGATFAAFPVVYASMFSFLYSALLLLLFALIFRGVAFEFRGQRDSQTWRNSWDWALLFGSFIPALLFGVAFGNIFEGLNFDSTGWHGSLLGLLNPYGLLTGVLFVLLFLQHGALWLRIKTSGGIAERSAAIAGGVWYALLAVAVVFLAATNFATHLYDNYRDQPLWVIVPLTAVAALLSVKVLARAGKYFASFMASCLTIMTVVFTGVIGLYPNMIPSSVDPAANLTIYNSSSSTYTLQIMTVVAVVFVPLVIAYQLWVYRIFREETGSGVYGQMEP